MKKVITVCLSLILAISALSFAFAEDFTIHAGTMFGETREEVKAKETLDLSEEVLSNADESYYTKDVGENIAYLIYDGTVAGYDKSHIYYYFNGENNDTLFEVVYSMPGYSVVGNKGVIDEYQDLKQSLIDKYGNPLSSNDEAYYLIESRSIGETNWTNEYFKNEFLPNYITDYDITAWSIPYEGYNVKIELVLYDSGERCNIIYHYYTDEEIEAARAAYGNTQSKKNDDL